MLRTLFGPMATALGCAMLTLPAHAQEDARSALRLECDALDEKTRAALEARARAQLLAEPCRGELRIRCDAGEATLSHDAPPAPHREARVPLAGPADVDGALETMQALCAPEPAPPPSPRSTEPARPAADEPTAAAPPAASAGRPHLSVLAMGSSELWSGGVSVALGGSIGARAALGRWSLSAAGGAEEGVGSALGISAWALRGAAWVDYAVSEDLVFGAGAGVHTLWAQAGGAQHRGTTGGVVFGARYVRRVDSVELAIGPWLEVLAQPIVVQMGAVEAFRVPTALASLALEGTFPAPAR